MPDRQLLVIPLPHGRQGDDGHLTVYFSPRLRETAALGQYPEWADWGNTVNSLRLRVIVDGVERDHQRGVKAVDPTVWQAVFDAKTPVRGHRPADWTAVADRLRTRHVGSFSEALLEYYAAMAVAPPAGDAAIAMPSASVLTASATSEAQRFVEPMEPNAPLEERIEEPRDPEWDFHQYVSVLTAHPHLLRDLGLAVDLVVDLPADPSRVRVRTSYDDGATRRAVDFSMMTTSDFWAASNQDAKELDDGFLRLEGDGEDTRGRLTILDAASSADRLRDLDGRMDKRSGNLPALRTRALTLVRPETVAAFRNRTERQWQIEEDIDRVLASPEPEPVDIWAEDVLAGQRIDVRKASEKRWWSLFARQTDPRGYRFPRDPELDHQPDPDEGWVQTTLATEIVDVEPDPRPDPDDPSPWTPAAERRLDDVLYRWDGWSGAVRTPGSALDGATGTKADEPPAAPPLDDPVQFATNYEVVPKSLPRLRFGTTYQMRARGVDLTGDGRTLDDDAPASALPCPETFGRLEPIAAPTVVRRTARPVPGVGDDAATIVLRSELDQDPGTVEPAERLLFPGQIGQEVCELHALPEGGVEPKSHGMLAARSAVDPDDGWVVDPVTGEPVADGPERQDVAYLADPMAGGLRVSHPSTGVDETVGLRGSWPELMSARVVAVAGDRGVELSPDAATDVRVAVAPADIDALELSYAPALPVEHFGLWHQLDDVGRAALGDRIVGGGHWMFSCRASIRVVHAVRLPLDAPAVTSWLGKRDAGSTGVTYDAEVATDGRSTGRVALTVSWTDLVDDVGLTGPESRVGGAVLGGFTTPRTDDETFVIEAKRAELRDTKHHLATISVEAFSAFSQYFTEERTVTIERGRTRIDERGVSASSVVVRTPDGNVAERGKDYEIDAVEGMLVDCRVGRLAAGDVVTVRYVPLPVSRISSERGAEELQVSVLSSVAPPPPTALEVVSAFNRTRTVVDGGEDVVHDGHVVRVYLARPWNVSGDGEQLAVVVGGRDGSRIARDPIADGATTPLTADAFTMGTPAGSADDGAGELVLHQVQYDEESRRWYTDIAVCTDMYRPFLQLTLARYQAEAIDGAQQSTPITLEPRRLGVSRTVSVTPSTESDRLNVTVTGPDHGGMDPDDATKELLSNEVAVVHQLAEPGIVDPFLKWRTDADSVVLTRTANGSGSTWSGSIDIPERGGRLLVEEREPIDALVYSETVDLT